MAQAIVSRGGGYVLAVKGNQPGLLGDARAAITAGGRKGAKAAASKDARHGRKETRTAIAATVGMAQRRGFPGLKAVARIKSRRGSDKVAEGYFLLSRDYTPPEVLRIAREHWTIENCLHWPLDAVLGEDLARNRKDNAPANLAVLRRLALHIARAHTAPRMSLRAKLKRAAWDENFLFNMLGNMR